MTPENAMRRFVGEIDSITAEYGNYMNAEHADRKSILLRAAYDLLTKADRAHYVLEAGSILTRYDEADCDGTCLREDIAHELGIAISTDPIPVMEEE